MKFEIKLAIKNIKGHWGRSAALFALAALLACSIFGGSIIIRSLQNGLRSYEKRLGADIIVIPEEAAGEGTFESILLQGIPGYFYMDMDVLEAIRGLEGVKAASPQFYLASASSGCCDTLVQIIGFDPDSDFSVKPWILKNYGKMINDGDVIVGSDIRIPENKSFRFYNVECRAVAKLGKTGTGLDSAIYADMNTIQRMMESADKIGFDYFESVEPENAVSSVLIDVTDGYEVRDVARKINLEFEGVRAISSKDMVSGISEGLSGVSKVVGGLIVFIWGLSIAVLIVSFNMIVNERVGELALLRIIGGTKKMLAGVLLWETIIISVGGGLLGNALASLVIISFSDILRDVLKVPLLLTNGWIIGIVFLFSVLVSTIVCVLTSVIAANRITSKDTALILREGL